MRNVKKAIVLLLSVLLIVAFANITLASTIQPRNTADEDTNEIVNDTNTVEENETTNNVANNTVNNTSSGLNTSNYTTNNASRINTTNTNENIPHTGIENTYLNLALFILLAVVLGMFSLVQYNRIVKNENHDKKDE